MYQKIVTSIYFNAHAKKKNEFPVTGSQEVSPSLESFEMFFVAAQYEVLNLKKWRR